MFYKVHFPFLLLLVFVVLFLSNCNQSNSGQEAFQNMLEKEGANFDLLISNGNVFNGIDSLSLSADLLINGDSIVFIGKVDTTTIEILKTIDASGKTVSPGFIDMHAHGDPFKTPAFQNFLSMGVTTICLGQDGFSPMQEDLNDWMIKVQDSMPGTNIAMFVGHSSLRSLSGINFKPQPADQEMEKIKQLLQSAFDADCFGLSTGLEYNPGGYAEEAELIELAKIVGKNDGMIMSHMRNEDDSAIENSINELLRQGEHCKVHVAHIKVVYGKGKERAEQILKILEKGRKGKYSVTADIYPYNASYTGIGIVFPQWAKGPNDYEQVKRERKTELLAYLKKKIMDRNGPEATLFGTAPYAGRTLAQVSKEQNKAFEEVLLEIGPTGASGAYFVMDDALQERLLADPNIMVCSDGSPTMHHPRGYGSFPKIIEEFVYNRKLFPLHEAIKKMTYLPAQTLGLKDRGVLSQGKKADILVFDPENVKANADFTNPHQLASGIDWVIVNGKVALQNGVFKEERYGVVLKK